VIRRQDLEKAKSRGLSHSFIVSQQRVAVELFNKEKQEIGRFLSSWRGIQDAFGQSTTRGARVGDFVWYGTTCFPELFSACFSFTMPICYSSLLVASLQRQFDRG
jgi:hypothetical protein